MSHEDQLRQAFAQALNLEPAQVVDSLAYDSIPEWDSTAHMVLIAELEGAFGVMLETADILGLSSVAKAREILARHGVSFAGA